MIAPFGEAVAPDEDGLRRDYAEYRSRQGRELVFMLPPEAVRPLLRRVHRTASPTDIIADDPLTALAEYCAALLPLPPFEVWLEDVRENPDTYLESLDQVVSAPTAASPTTLEARRFLRAGTEWVARLRAFRDDDVWRGFISFEADGRDAAQRTALVFCEDGPREVRDRFLSFEIGALESFLHSATA